MNTFQDNIDLFEHEELQPQELKAILDKWSYQALNGLTYLQVAEMQKEVNEIGFEFDSGLDAEPYNLRPIIKN